jgi:hypothetical protein
MADIKNKFVLFNSRAKFEENKANIASESIVFIADQQKIYTQGKFFTKDAFSKYQVGNSEVYAQNGGWDGTKTEAEGILKFVAGEGLTATAGANGEITYSLATGSYTPTVNENGANTGKFIKNITVNAYGQVTAIEYADIVQNTYDFKSAKSATDGNAKLTFSMTDALNAENNKKVEVSIKGKSGDKISVTSDAEGNIEVAHNKADAAVEVTSSVVDDQVSVLGNIKGDAWGHLISATQVSVPTKTYVDSEVEKLENLVGTSVEAALILQGTVSKDADLPETSVKGHTYKVAASFTSAKIEGEEKQLNPGDVIICVGVGADGKNPVWAAIQSNVDIAGPGVLGLVKDGESNEASRIYGVKVAGDGSMTVNVPAQHIPTVTSSVVTAGSATAEANAAVAEAANKVYVNHLDKSDADADAVITSHSFAGSGAVKVSANGSGDITIAATDNDTTYALAYSEDASGSTVSITPTKYVNGTAQAAGAAQSITVSAWAYPDKA